MLKSRLLFKKIANFTGKLLQNYQYLEYEISIDTFEICKQSFIIAVSIWINLPFLNNERKTAAKN